MLRALLLLCLAATTAAADVRFGSESFVAAPRLGYGTELVDYFYRVTVTEGDGQFLITWVDQRSDNPAFTGEGSRAAPLALRVDASGRMLDPHPFALPFYSPTTVWTGTDWIIVGERAARISREGEVTAISDVQFPTPYAPPLGDAAWTGEALVVARVLLGVDGPGLIVRTIDARFQLVEERTFLRDADGGTVVAAASDGTSAVVAHRRNHYANEPTQLAVFGRDGRMTGERVLLPGPTYETIAAGPQGYMAIGVNPATGRYEGTILDGQGEMHATQPVVIPSDPNIQFGRQLFWDGAGFTFVRYGAPGSGAPLTATRFDARGRIVERPKELYASGTVPEVPVLAFMGNTVAMIGRVPIRGRSPAHTLDIRVAPALRSLFQQRPIEIPTAATPRETPAAATNGTNVLVVWRERPVPRAALNVAATLLRTDGTPVDGTVLALGSGSCHGVPPAVTTNGRDFLVAWTAADSVSGAIVRGDGSAGRAFRIGGSGPCSDAQVSLASNGSQYVAVWTSADPAGRLQVHGVRISNDGAILDPLPLRIGSAAVETATSTVARVASNGTDFLVAWDHMAARVTAGGTVLDPSPLSLGSGNVHGAWFNGRTYVVAVYEPGFYRFYRIAADGSGGEAGPSTTAPKHSAAHQIAPLLPACDATGCLAAGYAGLLRIQDRGNEFVLTHLASNLDISTIARPVLVRGDRLMVVYARSVPQTPYSHAPAILLRAVEEKGGKQRSVRH